MTQRELAIGQCNSWYFHHTSDKGQLFSYSVKIGCLFLTASTWAKKASTALPTKRAEPGQGRQATLFGQEVTFCLRDDPTSGFPSNRNKTCRGQAEARFEKLVLSL